MNKIFYIKTTNFLAQLNFSLMLYGIAFFIQIITGLTPCSFIKTGIVPGIMLIIYVTNIFKKNVFRISGIVFALGLIGYFLVNQAYSIPQKILFTIIWILAIIIFFIGINTGSNDVVEKGSIAPIAVVLIGCFLIPTDNTSNIIYLSALVIICTFIYLINTYLVNTYRFFEGNVLSGVANFNKAMTKSRNLAIPFIIISTLIMCITTFLPSLGMTSSIKDLLFNIVRTIIRFLSRKTTGTAPGPVATPSPTPMPTLAPSVVTSAPDKIVPAVNIRFLDNYLIFPALLGGILISLLIVICVVSIINKRKKIDNDVRSFVSPFEKDEKLSSSTKAEKESLISKLNFRNPNKIIRKTFKNTIFTNSRFGQRLHKSLTPKELCDTTDIKNKENTLYKMKDLYEKARYSQTPCTKEDLVTLNEIKKEL